MIIHECEQRSEEWYDLRLGMPTASRFSELLTPATLKQSKSIIAYSEELAGEMFLNQPVDPWLGNKYTENGIEKEPFAVGVYAFKTDTEPFEVGLVTDDNNQYGCSPDRLVGDDGQIEIKCLLGKHHISKIMEYDETGECPKEYNLQVQGQLFVCERKWCDLVLYHDLLPPKIIRVMPDKEIHEKLAEQIKIVIEKRDQAVEILTKLQRNEV